MENEFFMDVWNFYQEHRDRFLYLGGDALVFEFCRDDSGNFSYLHICKLCFLFSGILGEQLPGHIHNRLVLGPGNPWVEEYMNHVSLLQPSFLGINLNANKFPRCSLREHGWIHIDH